MKVVGIIFLMIVAFHLGRWDAKYGAEVGYRYGKMTRQYLIKNGWIND